MLETFSLQPILRNFFSFLVAVSKIGMMIIQYPKKCKNPKKFPKKVKLPNFKSNFDQFRVRFRRWLFSSILWKIKFAKAKFCQNFKFPNSFWATVEKLKKFSRKIPFHQPLVKQLYRPQIISDHSKNLTICNL